MKFDWKKTVKAIAPLIGTAVGGPWSGLAVAAITKALDIPAGSTPEDVSLAVENATPEQLIALKKADLDFKARMKELGIREDELEYADRDSARRREVALGGDRTVQALAILIMAGFFGMCAYLLGFGLREGVNSGLAGMVVGYASAKAEQVCNYYFGSSKGSKDKTILASMNDGKQGG